MKKNTIKSEKKCEKTFLEYCRNKNIEDLQYWKWPAERLSEVLAKFWFEVRNQEGNMYRVSTLKHYRYALNRCLECHGLETDLIHSPCYGASHKAFKQACAQLKKMGLGYVESYPEIAPKGT